MALSLYEKYKYEYEYEFQPDTWEDIVAWYRKRKRSWYNPISFICKRCKRELEVWLEEFEDRHIQYTYGLCMGCYNVLDKQGELHEFLSSLR